MTSLAQIVAALSVTYSDEGVLRWLTAERRASGLSAHSMIADGDIEDVADEVRAIGDADPAEFRVVQEHRG